MHLSKALSVCAVATAAAFGPLQPARGQCTSAPVSIQVTTTGSYVTNCQLNPITNHWDVTVTINGAVTTNSTVTIRGANTLMLGKVTIQNNTAIDCRLNILGSGFDQRIGGVGFIDKGTSATDRVLLLQLITAGDVGYDKPATAAIHADMIANLSVGGSILGDMISDGFGRTMTNVFINGDVRGTVSLGPNSSIHDLWVGGNLGMPAADPVRVFVSGNILNLTAAAINADITTLANNSAGTVHSIDVTTGAFKGSLRAHRLGYLADGAGPPQFHVIGDLDASLTITRDIRVPTFIGGSFSRARTVAGSPVANIITTGTGLFDDPAAAATSNMTVAGDFAGDMVLGTPLATGLASINRPLVIGGQMSGSVSCAQDIDADISIGGVMSGRIDATGSARLGRTITCGGPMTGTISVGGSLAGGVSVPSGGLAGQVVVNAGGSSGAWSGPVTIGGSTMFSPMPYYTTKSNTVGGGAVGVAPFKAHLDDCSPAHNSTGPDGFALISAFTTPGATPVLFRAYGPLQPPAGQTLRQAVAVEQQVGAAWVDRSAYFNIDFVPPAPAGRVIGLSLAGAGNPPTGQYRLRNNSLQCAGVTGNPPVVWPAAYLFRIDTDCNNNGVGDSADIAANAALDSNHDGVLDACQGPPTPTCPCDYNNSGAVTVQDIFDFLAGYFTANPSADYNHSGTVTVQDIFDFLACYFTRPTGC